MDFEKLYIDTEALIIDLIPHFKRKDIFKNFLGIIGSECQVVADDMYELAWKSKETLKYDGRIGVYEEFLNDYWDNTQRRIYITLNNVGGGAITLYLSGEYDPSPDVLWTQSEGKSQWTLYSQSEIATLTYFNYTIFVPSALYASWSTDHKNKFRANAAIYTLTGNTFDIQTF